MVLAMYHFYLQLAHFAFHWARSRCADAAKKALELASQRRQAAYYGRHGVEEHGSFDRRRWQWWWQFTCSQSRLWSRHSNAIFQARRSVANTHTRRGVLVGLYINTWWQTSIDEVSLFFECWLHVCNDFSFLLSVSVSFLWFFWGPLATGSVPDFSVSQSINFKWVIRWRYVWLLGGLVHISLCSQSPAPISSSSYCLTIRMWKKRSKDKSDNPKAPSPSASAAPDKDSATDAS